MLSKNFKLFSGMGLLLTTLTNPILMYPISPNPLVNRIASSHVSAPLDLLNMRDLLKQLSQTTRLSYIIDNEPSVLNATIDLNGSRDEVLARIADKFSYRYSTSTSGVALFRKRFDNRTATVQTQDEELLASATDIVTLLREIEFDDRPISVRFGVLLKRFTKAEISEMISTGKHVRVGDMLVDQKRLAVLTINSDAVYSAFIQWDGFRQVLTNWRNSKLSISDLKILEPGGSPASVKDMISLVHSGVSNAKVSLSALSGDIGTNFQVPPIEKGIRQPRLYELIGNIGAKAGLTIKFEPSIRDRIVSGEFDSVGYRESLDALCELYGWQWSSKQDGTLFIGRRPVKHSKNLGECMRQVSRRLPIDVQDLLKYGFAPTEINTNGDPKEFDQVPIIVETRKRNAAMSAVKEREKLEEQFLRFRIKELLQLPNQTNVNGSREWNCNTLPTDVANSVLRLLLYRTLVSTFKLSSGFVSPYQQDPNNAYITLRRNGESLSMSLMYYVAAGGYDTGFATSPSP